MEWEDTRITAGLFSAKGKEGFYGKLGFVERPNEQRGAGMGLILNGGNVDAGGACVKHIKVTRRGIFCITCLMVVLLSLASCGETPSNGLLKNVTSEPNALTTLTLYYFDGEKVYQSQIFGSSATLEVLDALDAVKATEDPHWTTGDITLPIYGLEINASQGRHRLVAWSNDRWITSEGTAYKFTYDFAQLQFQEEYRWFTRHEYPWNGSFPCARVLSLDANGWNPC